jgi:uncharacterized protein YjiK
MSLFLKITLFLFTSLWASALWAETFLTVVDEAKLYYLLPNMNKKANLEASGVAVKDQRFYVIFDNMTDVAVIARMAKNDPKNHLQKLAIEAGLLTDFEGLSFHPKTQHLFVLNETQAQGDAFEGGVFEYDSHGLKKYSALPYRLLDENKGFEGISVVNSPAGDFLLAVCEGNQCEKDPEGQQAGHGRMVVFKDQNGAWVYQQTIELPETVQFIDYAGLAIDNNRIALVSQESSALWLGKIDTEKWQVGEGKTYSFPRDAANEVIYCNVEGIAWLDEHRLVAVSDQRKKSSQPERCKAKDQSIHMVSVK